MDRRPSHRRGHHPRPFKLRIPTGVGAARHSTAGPHTRAPIEGCLLTAAEAAIRLGIDGRVFDALREAGHVPPPDLESRSFGSRWRPATLDEKDVARRVELLSRTATE